VKQLLTQLGYQRSGYGFRHDERQVVFVGDFIDRGPANAEAIQIARATVDDGNGHAVMGNHEFNAIGFHTRRPDGSGFFRPRNGKNQHQHQATLDQLSSLEMQEAIEWFKTLPVAIKFDEFRVVHASWQPSDIEVINTAFRELERFTPEFLTSALDLDSPLHRAVENVLKGPEIKLPNGVTFRGPYGQERDSTRVRWYADPAGMSIQDYSIGAGDGLPDLSVPEPEPDKPGIKHYSDKEPPVFFGHYWLDMEPKPLKPNVACVDYSVAKGGKLCAYQWNAGDTSIKQDQYVWVDSRN
jgi:hypothetical protein